MAYSVSDPKGERNEMMTRTSDKRIVTIDQGNSSLKAVAWSGSAAEDSVRLAEASVEGLLPLFENGEVDGCEIGRAHV